MRVSIKPVHRPKTFVSRLILTALLLGMLAGLTGCALVHHYGAFEGRVIETETGEPIEGAAVLVSYYTVMYTPAGEVSSYLDSKETLTDALGAFKIPAQFSLTFRPLNFFEAYGSMVIFKPGYGCFPDHQNSRPRSGLFKPDNNITVQLSKLKTREERRLNASCTPAEGDYPMLLQLLNQERVEIGIPPLPAPK